MLIKQQTYIFAQLAGFYLLNYVYNAFLANHLNPSTYGEIALILQFLIFAMPFMLMGSDIAMMRFVPHYLEKKQYKLYFGYKYWSINLSLIPSVILFTLAAFITLISMLLDKIHIFSFDDLHPIFYSLWLMPLFAYINYQDKTLRCLKLSSFSNLSSLYTFLSLVMLMILQHFKLSFNAYEVILSLGISMLMILGVQYLLFIKYQPTHFSDFIFNSKLDKEWRNSSLQLMWNIVIFTGIASIDIFMMQLLDTPIRVGMLNILMTITSIFLLIEKTTYSVISPLISPLVIKEDLFGLQKIYNKMLIFKMTIGFILFGIITIFAKELLQHFGNMYVSLALLLKILSFAYLIYTWLNSATIFLLYTEHQHILLRIGIAQLITVVILDLVLIPLYHVTGAVIALIIGFIVAESLAIWALRLYLKIKILIFV